MIKSSFHMTFEKPKPKQLQSQAQAKAYYHFQPTMNREWNSRGNLPVFTKQRVK